MPAKTRRIAGLRVVTRKGTAFLYLRGTVRGRRVFESAGTADYDLAEEARAAREAELFRGAVHGFAPTSVGWGIAAESYLDEQPRAAATLAFVRRLTRVFGGRACRDIDQLALDEACRILCKPGAKPATRLRNVISPTRAILTHAALRGWCETPHFKAAKASASRLDWFTPAQASAMINAATGRQAHLRPLLTFLFCTGARLGEALELTWADVDLRYARAVFRDTKGGRDRQAHLPIAAVVALANLAHREGRVFRARGRAYRATGYSETVGYGGQIRSAWRTCLQRAGILHKLTPHHTRHSWATWYYAVHRDVLKLKIEGGWATMSQVERYTHPAPSELPSDVLAFWDARADIVQPASDALKKQS